MQIQVSGRQIDIGDALRQHVSERLTAGVAKYFDNVIDANVTFSREGHGYKCDCSVHGSAGINLFAEASAGDIYASFDLAAERMEKRLRRYKRRLKDHKARGSRDSEAFAGKAYVIDAGHDEAEEHEGAEPAIIAETAAQFASMTVGEAVMRLDLSNAPVFVFRNGKSGGVNVVYRRPDGHIGWVDPSFDPPLGSPAGKSAGKS
ncbi:MAG TPA: ribosome-associated translation inhibitor RaiA [Micropepsaceae bacterium]|nr:ribosome-associated translation inhibitor RaiA [Micropepsaceae bacterium]